MELNFGDEDCGSFTISSNGRTQAGKSSTKNIMTDPIPYEDKNIETRAEMKDSSEQCDFEPKTITKEEFSVPSLLGFLKKRIPLIENTFRE